jgi:hypothetical protein
MTCALLGIGTTEQEEPTTMGRRLRAISLLLLIALLPSLPGCGGGGVGELVVTAKVLYGVWQLYRVFDDGSPSWISAASALLKLGKDLDYSLDHVDDQGNVTESETGTWSVENGTVLVLNVDQSTIDPAAQGTVIRLPARFTDQTRDSLSLTRRVTEGQVTISQEQVYQRVPS